MKSKSELNRALAGKGTTRRCTFFSAFEEPAKFKCLVCGGRSVAKPGSVLRRPGCQFCNKKKLRADQRVSIAADYRKVCKKKGLLALEPYRTALTRIKHKCLKCGNEFSVKPNDVKTRKDGFNGCMVCRREKQKEWYSPFEEYAKRIEARGKVKVVGKGPVTNGTGQARIQCRCLTCKVVFVSRRQDLLNGHGCPECGFKIANRSRYKSKDFQLGSRVVQVQGYEPFALSALLKKGVRPSDIVVAQDKGAPVLRLSDGTRHYPDIYVKSRKTIVEVKSTYTFGLHKDKGKSKKQAFSFNRIKFKATEAKKQGFNYRVWLINGNGRYIKLPPDWADMTRLQLRKEIAVLNPTLCLQ